MSNNKNQNLEPSISALNVTNHDNSRPLRVLYITHDSILTGASRSLLDLLSEIDRRQVEPTVLLRRHGPIEEKLKEIDVPYVIFTYAQATISPHKLRPTVLKKILNYFATRKISNYIKHNNFDIIHQNSLIIDIGMRAALRANTPYICHIREYCTEDHGIVLISDTQTMQLMQGAALNIFISHAVADRFSSWIPETQHIVLYDGLNINNYYSQHQPILESPPYRLLLVGRFERGKQQLDAIQAIEMIRKKNYDAHLTLIGNIRDQKYFDECHKYLVDHNLESVIKIHGFCNDLHELRSEADIELMCSPQEAMGRVTIEGMLAGSLVIGVNAGATPEIITDKNNGLLYEVDDIESLADTIIYAIEHPNTMRTIAHNAQEWAKNKYDSKAYAQYIQHIYREIILDRAIINTEKTLEG